MAIKLLESSAEEGRDDLPWINEFVKIGKNLHPHMIEFIKVTEKGYYLETEAFKCFVWNKSSAWEVIKELFLSVQALAAKQYSPESLGYFVVPQARSKNKFQLAMDDEVTCVWLLGKGSLTLDSTRDYPKPLPTPVETILPVEDTPPNEPSEPKRTRRSSKTDQ